MLDNLKKYKILLASKSPRRRELLAELRIPFNVVSIGGIDETYPDTLPCDEIPQYLANKKADVYISTLKAEELALTAECSASPMATRRPRLCWRGFRARSTRS